MVQPAICNQPKREINMELPATRHPESRTSLPDALMGAEILPATAVSAGCVIAKDALDDVVTYLRAGQMPPAEMRRIAAMLLGISTQLALHADAAERELVRAAAADDSEL